VSKDPLLQVSHLSKSFDRNEVLRDINLTCNEAEVVCIIGPSGSGKSTLVHCINHLVIPDSGTVYVDGQLIGYEPRNGNFVSMKEHGVERQRRDIGMVFQHFNLFPHMTVLDNVTLAPRLARGIDKRQAVEIAMTTLRQVGLADRKDSFARQLSGGQQQRVAIARALAMEPKLMLFDEPTSALDPELVGEVLNVMRALVEKGMTMVVVTHELQFARDVANTVVFMDDGVVVERGDPRDVLTNPNENRTQSFISRLVGDGSSNKS
jgi:polar amino acid transport system ATP-binding protein